MFHLHERFKILTLGCKVNIEESERLKRALQSRGFQEVESLEDAQVIFINSCVVTANAERKTRSLLKKALENSKAKIFLMGCSVPIKHKGIPPWLDEIYSKYSDRLQLLDNLEKEALLRELGATIGSLNLRGRPFLKVQEGCDKFCSYCIVAYRRGAPRSLPFEEAKSRLMALYDEAREKGLDSLEVVLVGTNLALWGREWGLRLEDLLTELLKLPSGIRIRLSSIDPDAVSDDLLRLIADYTPRLRPHLHLSLQSLSDKVLEAMRRTHRRADMERIIERITQMGLRIGLTGDIIVGFPVEGDEEFKETYEWLKGAPLFHRLHVFRYSPRPGTVSYVKFNGRKLDSEERARLLIELSKELSYNYISKRVGEILEVSLDIDDEKPSYGLMGYTEDYLRIRLRPPKETNVKTQGILQAKLLTPLRPETAYWIADAVISD